MNEPLPPNLYWEDRNGWPYYIVTKRDGSTQGFWDREEAIAIARLHQDDE